LPTGEQATSWGAYAKAWREFAKPIELATGMRAYGYEPGIAFANERETISLHTWFIQRINAALKAVK
jgi:hypothetical protein